MSLTIFAYIVSIMKTIRCINRPEIREKTPKLVVWYTHVLSSLEYREIFLFYLIFLVGPFGKTNRKIECFFPLARLFLH